MAANLAEKAAAMFCMQGELKGLTPRQKHALHILKHDFITGIYRVYQELDPEKADVIVAKRVREVLEEVTRERERAEEEQAMRDAALHGKR